MTKFATGFDGMSLEEAKSYILASSIFDEPMEDGSPRFKVCISGGIITHIGPTNDRDAVVSTAYKIWASMNRYQDMERSRRARSNI